MLAFHKALKPFASAWVSELPQSLGFDLANALARDGKLLADFFKGVIGFLTDSESHSQNLFFSRG